MKRRMRDYDNWSKLSRLCNKVGGNIRLLFPSPARIYFTIARPTDRILFFVIHNVRTGRMYGRLKSHSTVFCRQRFSMMTLAGAFLLHVFTFSRLSNFTSLAEERSLYISLSSVVLHIFSRYILFLSHSSTFHIYRFYAPKTAYVHDIQTTLLIRTYHSLVQQAQ